MPGHEGMLINVASFKFRYCPNSDNGPNELGHSGYGSDQVVYS